jgi:response regulator of citrate/malate metabolism
VYDCSKHKHDFSTSATSKMYRLSGRLEKGLKKNTHSPALLLISEDEQLAGLVGAIVKPPWRVVHRIAATNSRRRMLGEHHVRVVIFDEEAVEEKDREALLGQITRFFSGASVLYVAATQSDANEKKARTNGAHYYVSKPLPLERFAQVLRSFLKTQHDTAQLKHPAKGRSSMRATELPSTNPTRIDAGIKRLSRELNREDSQIRSYLLDAALAGLRLARSPESLELRRDAVQIWSTIKPVLSRHLDIEDNELLPWLDQQGHLSLEVGRKVFDCHDKLQKLIGAIINSGTKHLTEAEIREVGRTLTALAVNLDDAIDDEERKLFPTIRRALFASVVALENGKG